MNLVGKVSATLPQVGSNGAILSKQQRRDSWPAWRAEAALSTDSYCDDKLVLDYIQGHGFTVDGAVFFDWTQQYAWMVLAVFSFQ